MPFFIKPFFRKPFKLFAIDADTGQPLDPNVHRRTRVTYYELAEGSNGSKKLVAHKSPSQITKEGGEEGKAEAEAEAKPDEGEGSKKEGEGSKKEGSKKEETAKEGSKKEGSKKEDAAKEGSKKEGSKKEDAQKEGSKKGDEAKPEHKGDDVAWTPEEDEKLKALKGGGKTWAEISVELGRHKGQLTVRWKEIKPPGSDEKGNKPADAKGGEGGKGQNDKEKQGKQGKKGKKGGDNHQNNNHNHQKKNDNKNTNDKSNQEKKESEKKPSSSKKEESSKPASKPASINKPTSKPASAKPASKPPSAKPTSISNSANAAANETRFTMTDWLTLQEDDMFSFGELQCLSELIGKDLSQSWQRVAAKFFDLTGRRIHPDDVRDKFERMAVMAQGGKGV
jgi:hypothetical protein